MSAQETAVCAFAMIFSNLQCVGMLGLMMELPGSSLLRDISSAMQVLVMDIDSIGFNCVAGRSVPMRYSAMVLFFPLAVLWLMVCYLVSRLLPLRLQSCRWKGPETRSTVGLLLLLGFNTMCTVAVMPLMCFSHPSGMSSLLKYPSVACASDEHFVMVVLGLLVLLFALGFVALCSYAALAAPGWSRRRQQHSSVPGSREDFWICIRAAYFRMSQCQSTYRLIGPFLNTSASLTLRTPTFHETVLIIQVFSVKSFRFLFFRFRLDCWWFGVPLLLRGSLLSLPIAVATNYPAVQVLMWTFVLLIFLVVGVWVQPWKVPLLNTFDCIMHVCIVMIVASRSLHVGLKEDVVNFLAAADIVIMSTLAAAILILCVVTASAVVTSGGYLSRATSSP